MKYYQGKAWLLDYKKLSLKSCYIARITNDPNRERIWEVNLDFYRPFYGQGSESNDRMVNALQAITRG